MQKSEIDTIFLITIDCGREDYLYTSKADTPSLDQLAGESVTFKNAFSQINSTIPSHVSLFTSRYPCDHGVYRNFDKPISHPFTLPSLLERSGWKTRAFTGVVFLSWLMGDWCSHRERISWIPALENPDRRGYGLRKLGIVKMRRNATKTIDRVLFHLRRGRQKEFYWIHLFDSHLRYHAPKKFLKRHLIGLKPARVPVHEEAKREGLFISQGAFDLLSMKRPIAYYPAAYRASIEYVDSEIGRLVQFLKKSKLWERSLFIVTSDHGENLTENGIFCDHTKLFDETTKVPLYWRDPAIDGGKEQGALVQHVDLYPSILDRLGIEVPAPIRGKSLYPLMEGVTGKGHACAFAEHAGAYQYTIRTEEWQYLWKNPEKEHPEGLRLEDHFLINRKNMKRTPYENLAHQYPGICQELRGLGETILSSPLSEEIETHPVSKSVDQILKSWGYL